MDKSVGIKSADQLRSKPSTARAGSKHTLTGRPSPERIQKNVALMQASMVEILDMSQVGSELQYLLLLRGAIGHITSFSHFLFKCRLLKSLIS